MVNGGTDSDQGAKQVDETGERKWILMVCQNRRLRSDLPSCAARGSVDLADALAQQIAARGLNLTVERTVCMGKCNYGPTVRLAPGGEFHLGLTIDGVPEFLDQLIDSLGIEEGAVAEGLPPPGS